MKIAARRRAMNRIRHGADSEDGGLTIFGLYIFVSMLILGGVAIDMANLMAARTQLQVATDIAAHTALYNRDTKTADDSRAAALTAVTNVMPVSQYGTVLTAADITFGTYDRQTQVFTANNTSRSAVLINTNRLAANSNAVTNFLLQFVGIRSWDLRVQSLFTTYRPACFREGFVANGIVDIQSNNGFTNGFCIHSNTYVSLNSNNTFEPGTIVSMPDTTQIDLPNSGWKTNIGLSAALREGAYRLRIVNSLPLIIAGLQARDPRYLPSYITNTTINTISARNVTSALLVQGRVNVVTCNNGKTTINGPLVTNVVILTSCEVTFSNGVVIDNAIVATTHTGSKSMQSPQGLQVGRNDRCAEGGGAQLLTMGSMNFAADLKIFGSQLIAAHDVSFAANANGIEGASIIAGGRIDGTSNMNMGFCGSGMNSNFEAEYFRLAG